MLEKPPSASGYLWQEGNMTKELIYRVTHVHAYVENVNELHVYAEGLTGGAGWTDLELRLRGSSQNEVRFGFIGTPPEHGAAVLTEVDASAELPLMPFFPTHVTVVAAENEITVPIEYVAAKQRIYEVTAVQATLDGNMLHVTAKGNARTTGWTSPELRQIDLEASQFELVATPPRSPVHDTITPIEAEGTFGPLMPPFPVEVTVCGETNCKSAPVQIGAAASAAPRSKPAPRANA